MADVSAGTGKLSGRLMAVFGKILSEQGFAEEIVESEGAVLAAHDLTIEEKVAVKGIAGMVVRGELTLPERPIKTPDFRFHSQKDNGMLSSG